jgi:eukaryotic-like serine/threonine-protein kinase
VSLTPGARLGAYEVLAAIGQGGMGEVYRARDTKLGRDVALKILPEQFATDPDRLARFRREAQVLASLNHPNIGGIHGLEESDGTRALVLELVEGETLADRIARGPIPLDEALPIARQIADALEAAHEHGIIHRDLKPSNIKLRSDGTVKVLDFGLAKALDLSPTGTDPSQSPTVTSPAMTQMGVILGTAAYMSPEQAKGRPADKRVDIWAFGCVLYEMLTGRRVFEGATTIEVLAGVFKADPDWRRLPAETPEGIERLLRRCLQKDSKLRLHDIADVRIELDETQVGPGGGAKVGRITNASRERLVWICALALVALFAGVTSMWTIRSVPSVPEMRLDITTPPTTDLVSFALSRDGRRIVFVADSEGRPRLWVRSLDSVSARPLAGTDFASYPFWSPDGRSIGFFSDGRLKRIDVDGRSLQVLASASNARGAVWTDDGTIVYAVGGTSGLWGIAAAGGEPVEVTRLGPQQQSHRFPQALPGGRRFLYYVLGGPDVRGVYVGALDGSESQRVLDADTAALYAPSGHLLFVRQGTLFAQTFDAAQLTLRGNPFPVAEQVSRDPLSIQLAAVSVSAVGPIAYRTGAVGVARRLAWFDRSGKELGAVGEPDLGQNANLSPDARRVVVDRTVGGNVDIWLIDLQRGTSSRFTSEATIDGYPIWSPDGRRIAFGSIRGGSTNLFWRSATGAGVEQVVLVTPLAKAPTDWSRDGRFLLYRSSDPKTGFDVWAIPLDMDGKPGTPFQVVQTPFEEKDAQFSPDGRWIAYESNESNQSEIYAQQFPKPEGKFRISTTGGSQVRWARGGNELFYVALDGRLMAVAVRFALDGKTMDAGAPTPLFVTRIGGALQGSARQQYMVSADGQRFLMNTIPEEAPTPITVVLNWKPPDP